MSDLRRARVEGALMGAFVADAAALGFHWLYDPARIEVLAGADPAFREPAASDFEGFKGVFVHPTKRAGDLSQYGAQLRVAVQSMLATDGVFDVTEFQDRFASAFGPGGSWTGYIDKATKGTLANLALDKRDPSGAQDDQVPGIARLPAAVVIGKLTEAEIRAIVAITSATDTAAAWGPVAGSLLQAAYDGMSPKDAAASVAQATGGEVGDTLRAAIETENSDTISFAGEVGRACSLTQAIPVIFHICAQAKTYREAIERNILAGGDNCGRAPVLGAVFGAAHGIGGQGVPLSWIGRLTELQGLSAEIELLCNSTR